MIIKNLEKKKTPLDGAFLIEPLEFEDERGKFYKVYNEEVLKTPAFVEEYLSVSGKNVLRGLHYQKGEFAQAKLVRCTKGKVYDAIVDLRKSSPSFSKSFAIVLSDEKMQSLYVPRGFAHGFVSLTQGAQVLYKADNSYKPEQEAGIIWDDADLKISWPVKEPVLSEKDKKWPKLKDAVLFE